MPGAGGARTLRLNSTAALILELCTGNNSRDEIVELIQGAHGPATAPEVVVQGFLAAAVEQGLLRPHPA